MSVAESGEVVSISFSFLVADRSLRGGSGRGLV